LKIVDTNFSKEEIYKNKGRIILILPFRKSRFELNLYYLMPNNFPVFTLFSRDRSLT
jgi:hypothetical protein